ncbi:MAG: PP2C family protein-serine/threonine phosphatase [Solirubrobacteraceae bacterium]
MSANPSLGATTADQPLITAVINAPVGDDRQGGDFYVIEQRGPCWMLLLGDVTGKGEQAAPEARRAAGAARGLLSQVSDPAELLALLNQELYADRDFETSVAMCALFIDTEKRAATWAFAGHVPPCWLDTGLPVDGATPGLPLGLEPVCDATSAGRRPLRPGEGLVLFTDGLEDVRGPGNDRFGIARISHTLASDLYGASPDVVVEGLKAAACRFGGGELYDDVCILAFRLTAVGL